MHRGARFVTDSSPSPRISRPERPLHHGVMVSNHTPVKPSEIQSDFQTMSIICVTEL